MRTVKIGRAFGPSKIIGTKIIEASEITISCGGGMGGSYWKEYTIDKFDLNDKFIVVNTNRNIGTQINTSNIVQVIPVKIARVTLKNMGHESFEDIEIFYYVVNAVDKIEFNNEPRTPEELYVITEVFK